MEKVVKVEGILYLPPYTVIKNPQITLSGSNIVIEEGASKNFTHKGVIIPSLVNSHTHLIIQTPIYANQFVLWIEKIISKNLMASPQEKAIQKSIEECKKLGIFNHFRYHKESRKAPR